MQANSNPELKSISRRPGLFSFLAVLLFVVLAVPVSFGQDATATKPQVVTPAAVIDILEIQPFRLTEGYHHDWLESRPLVSEGLLVVLRVDPSYVVPRNAAEPVLYAGDVTVQRLNQGDVSGHVIGIIPGDIDLAAVPIWFGRPELPERVTPEVIQEERDLAESAGIKPFSSDKVKSVRRDVVDADDLAALLRGPAADLVLEYSPEEKELAGTWRLPTTGAGDPR